MSPLGNYSLKSLSVLDAYDNKNTTMTINCESYCGGVTSGYRHKQEKASLKLIKRGQKNI